MSGSGYMAKDRTGMRVPGSPVQEAALGIAGAEAHSLQHYAEMGQWGSVAGHRQRADDRQAG